MTQPPRRRPAGTRRRPPDDEGTANTLSGAALDLISAAEELRHATQAIARQMNQGGYGGGGGDNGGYGRGGGARRYRGVADPRPSMHEDQTARPDHGVGLAGLRNRLADQLERKVGVGSGSTFTERKNASGQVVGYTQHHANGTRTQHAADEEGIQEQVAAASTRAGRSGMISNAMSGNMVGKLKGVPIVGEAAMALEAVNAGLSLYGHEREKNAYYQSIYGGTNFGTGFHNRRLQEGFKLSQRFSGGLTGPQADAAFKGVSELGFAGEQRSQDLNFISANYKSLGVGVAESLKLVQIASKSANEHLIGLSEGIKSVSSAAKSTNQSGVAARQILTQNTQTLSQSFPGAGTQSLTNAVSTVQTASGRYLSQNVDVTGMLTSIGGQASAGAPFGQTYGQVEGNIMLGGNNAAGYIDAQVTSRIGNLITPAMKQFVQRELDKTGGLPNIAGNGRDPSDWMTTVAGKMMQANMFEPAAVWAALSSTGMRLPPAEAGGYEAAAVYLVSHMIGLTNYAAQQNKDKNKYWNAKTTTKKIAVGPHAPNVKVPTTKTTTTYPFLEMASKKLMGKTVTVQTKDGPMDIAGDVAARGKYADQIISGEATMQNGSSIKDFLGGYSMDPSQYKGPKSSDKSSYVQTFDPSFNSFFGNNPTKHSDYLAKGGGSVGVVISASPELKNLLTFTPTGTAATNAAAAQQGVQVVPGSK